MKKSVLPLLLLLAVAACKKDDSSNVSADAADSYVGNWLISDTVQYTYSLANLPDEYHRSTGSISKKGKDAIRFNNFFTNLCTELNANVTATSIALVKDSTLCSGADFPEEFVASRRDSVISFSYKTTIGPGYVAHYRGRATKQP